MENVAIPLHSFVQMLLLRREGIAGEKVNMKKRNPEGFIGAWPRSSPKFCSLAMNLPNFKHCLALLDGLGKALPSFTRYFVCAYSAQNT